MPDPANEAPANGGPPPAAPEPAHAVPVIHQPQPVPTGNMTLARADYEKMLGDMDQLQQFRQQEAERAAQAEVKALKALADKDGAEAALQKAREAEQVRIKERDDQISALRGRWIGEKKAAAIATLTATTTWTSPSAAKAALRDLADRFEARESADGSVVVVEKGTLRPADQAIPELLKTEDFTFYQRAATKGGAGAGNSMAGTPPVNPNDEIVPSNPGQEAFALWLSQLADTQQKGYSGIGFGGPGFGHLGVRPSNGVGIPFGQTSPPPSMPTGPFGPGRN